MNKPIPSINDRRIREIALGILQAGGVVILPTDTLYGFSASLSSAGTAARIARIKGGGGNRRFIYLAGSVDMIEPYVRSFGCATRALLAGIWPAALTAILPASEECSRRTGPDIGFRVPDFKPLLGLINDLGEPIVSTSVNRGGESPLVNIHEIHDIFGSLVDFIVAGNGPDGNRGVASTVVDFTGDKPVIIRAGDYDWEGGGGNPSK